MPQPVTEAPESPTADTDDAAEDTGASIRPLPENWLRTDVTVALVVAAFGILTGFLSIYSPFYVELEWTSIDVMIGAGLLALPLIFYRRYPLVIAPLTCTIYFCAGAFLGFEANSAQVVLFLSIYALGAWEHRRRIAFWMRLVIIILMAVWLAWATLESLTGEAPVSGPLVSGILVQWLINLVFFGAAWIFGDRAWDSAMDRLELERAHAELQSAQSVIAEQAVEFERLRIARELHDVVAHHVTVMGVHAAAARRLLSTDPPRSEAAASQLTHVEDASQEAIGDLRTLVYTLRDSAGSAGPLPGLEDLAELTERADDTTQTVTYDQVGEAVPVGRAVELTLYRVAQEALSNARKHAGATASVHVRLRYGTDAVELEVSDDGRAQPLQRPGTGTGLQGMRERINAIGATIHIGPKSRGGWLVRARVPYKAQESA
ncbi:sensor histidine kinase [Citricoccus muralis]|uniref:histidine kinase n=1 Tax=Citricoccus muralis TaxID=169134 RepID=A0ABY8H7D7_9MICC|nr:sensor histidine kinase [Citricoccus muralis]WFP17055.1 sensor histidine kinase [Citricoccus muralis]